MTRRGGDTCLRLFAGGSVLAAASVAFAAGLAPAAFLPAAVAADHELQMSLATQRALSVAVRDAVRRAIRAAPRLLLLLRHHLSHVSNLRA